MSLPEPVEGRHELASLGEETEPGLQVRSSSFFFFARWGQSLGVEGEVFFGGCGLISSEIYFPDFRFPPKRVCPEIGFLLPPRGQLCPHLWSFGPLLYWSGQRLIRGEG